MKPTDPASRMMKQMHFGAWLALTLSMSVPSISRGQGLLTEAEGRQLEEHLSNGAKAYKANRFGEAIEHYQAAQTLKDDPQIQYAIARSYQQMSDCERATELYNALILRDDTPNALADKAKSRLTNIEHVCVSKGTLSVICSEQHATLKLGDQQYSCPLKTTLEVGAYSLTATTPQGWIGEKKVEIEAGKETVVEIKLVAPVKTVVRRDSRNSSKKDESPNTMRLVSYGVMALGSGLLVGGFVSDSRASGRTEDLARAIRKEDTATIEELEQDSASAKRRTVALYGVGAGVLVTGLVLRLIAPSESSSLDEGVLLDVSHHGVTLQTRVRW